MAQRPAALSAEVTGDVGGAATSDLSSLSSYAKSVAEVANKILASATGSGTSTGNTPASRLDTTAVTCEWLALGMPVSLHR
jgi:hypothetical protein